MGMSPCPTCSTRERNPLPRALMPYLGPGCDREGGEARASSRPRSPAHSPGARLQGLSLSHQRASQSVTDLRWLWMEPSATARRTGHAQGSWEPSPAGRVRHPTAPKGEGGLAGPNGRQTAPYTNTRCLSQVFWEGVSEQASMFSVLSAGCSF